MVRGENLFCRKKIAFFVKQGLDSFLEDIINTLSHQYETKKNVVTHYGQIEDGMQWADICWFEWCDELIAYGSKSPLVSGKKLICRLHSYEAFTDYPATVNWDAVDKLIFVGEHIRDFTINKFKINKEKTIVIPNGINVNSYKYKERSLGFNIAYVGYINYKKGPMLLLHTFKAIYDKDNRYKLFIAGEFQDERDILYYNKMLREFGLLNNVFFTGWQTNLDEWLEDKNYILCTSILESQNISVMQAMAKGIKPIIHNFVGAENFYSKEYIFNTIEEATLKLLSKYDSFEYRNNIDKLYNINITNKKIKDEINNIINNNENIPLVTIGITNYNYGKYVGKCIESVVNQNYSNIEIIVIDDCSKDDSCQIIKDYEQRYDNIKAIYHSENTGSGLLTIREIVENATGEYFLIIDADDYFPEETTISTYVDEMLKSPDIDYIYADRVIVDENENKSQVWAYKEYSNDNELISEVFKRFGSGVIPMYGMYRTAFYKKDKSNWYYDAGVKIGYDTLNCIVNTKKGWKRKHIDKILLCYRQHESNISYDVKTRIKSLCNVTQYIIDNFIEEMYFKEVVWKDYNIIEKEGYKCLLLAKYYFDFYKLYYFDNWKPWSFQSSINKEQMLEYLKPVEELLNNYLNKTCFLSNRYVKEAELIKNELIGLKNEAII